MLAAAALQQLKRDLAESLAAMGLTSVEWGRPKLVEKAVSVAVESLKDYGKAKPSNLDAYRAAVALIRGHTLTARQRDLVAAAVARPIEEEEGAVPMGAEQFSSLLSSYAAEAERGELWRLTWHGLLYSYFSFDLQVTDPSAREGWKELRVFLEKTWPLVDRQSDRRFVPDWIKALRGEPEVLSATPVRKYATSYLAGDTAPVDMLARDLGIPPSSWFWHALVLSAVRAAVGEVDARFIELIPDLLKLVHERPGFRDEALEAILTRYHACKGAGPHEQLRDYVCQANVWKNPKLKAAGIATAWNRVDDAVWLMVLGWVNERNLKDFFDVLAARNNADEGRLAFWSRYLKQITWTRLVFGADTLSLKRSNAGIRALIAREEGAYAQLSSNAHVDAFMMQIGDYIIVEFSKKPNACYVYRSDKLPFDRYERVYGGTSYDLKNERRSALRIVHGYDWAAKSAAELRRLGIRPDGVGASPAYATATAPAATIPAANATNATARPALQARSFAGGAVAEGPGGPDMNALALLVAQFPGTKIEDGRGAARRDRLWVIDPMQRQPLAAYLKTLGFKWSDREEAWYFVEN